MAGTAFAFELASGVYVDADGQLIPGQPPAGTPVYKSPWQLPVDPGKVRDALKEVKDALNGLQKNQQFLLDLHIWAGDQTGAEVLNFIKGVSAIAGAVAPVFAAVAVAAQLAQMFGLFSKGPDPLTALIDQRFTELQQLMVSQSQQDFLTANAAIRGDYLNISNVVHTLFRRQGNSTLEQYLIDQQSAANTLNLGTGVVLRMFNPAGSWGVLQDESRLSTWKAIQGRLFNMAPDGQAAPCIFRHGLMFDHRPMVPFVIAVTIQYLTCLRTLSPEYRSTGEFIDTLIQFGEGLEGLANQMRQMTLARTIYRPEDFQLVLMSSEVQQSFLGKPAVRTTRWPVGALDVLQHDDVYIGAQLAVARQGQPPGFQAATLRAGCMDYAWSPPARLTPVVWEQGGLVTTQWRIDNPQECADAANAQAEKDYADLLVLSGYVQLMHLATLCRHEATEPDRSQTVSIPRQPLLIYSNQTDKNVRVESHWMMGGAHVSANAVQRSRGCWASVRFKTQPIKRAKQLLYRVVLRTLPDLTAYDNYFKPYYVPDPNNPGIMKLVIDRDPAALDSKPIPNQWLPSPRNGAIHYEGTEMLLADTYNWFTPVMSILGSLATLHDFNHVVEVLGPKGLGNTSGDVAAPSTPVPAGGSALSPTHSGVLGGVNRLVVEQTAASSVVLGEPPSLDPRRSAREKVRQAVEVKWTVDWEADELMVSVHTKPAARSVRIFVVVEELFVLDNNNVMETACEIPMDGLISLVPQKFFDDEVRAMVEAAKAIASNVGRVPLEVGNIHPPGPVELQLGLVDPVRLEQTIKMLQAAHPGVATYKANFNDKRAKRQETLS